tara:strand:+ start:406 stop:636 length:231 start_codon:yes stop_codon:yes gene_type:complete
MDSISDKVKKIRVEYEDKPLNLEDLNQDPLEQFNTWFQIAIDAEVNEANAMAISTISQEEHQDLDMYCLKILSITN